MAPLLVNAAIVAALLVGASGVSSHTTNRALRVGLRAESQIQAHALLSAEFGAELRTEESFRQLAAKPIRIGRGGGDTAKKDEMGKKQYKKEELHVGTAQCGQTVKTNSSSDKKATCPDDCEFYAQDKTDDAFCSFRCVKESQCTSMNPKTPIGDPSMGICRSCLVDGCDKCHPTKSDDYCDQCQVGYNLVNGLCVWKYYVALYAVLGVVACVMIPVLVWVLDMAVRPTSNQEGLDQAMEFRERQKLRQPPNEQGRRELWPLSTNLCSTMVAGPGMILHFNFQAGLIIWACFVGSCWLGMVFGVDRALLVLGTRRFGTPRENCILVAWGYETQKRLMWTKVLFLVIVYVGSWIMHFFHCVRQLRTFQAIDFENKTMKDYVAMVEGMPAISGSENLEEDLKKAIAAKSGVPVSKIVGVSVAWDYQEKQELVQQALDKNLDDLDGEQPALSPGEEVYSGHRLWLFQKEKAMFSGDEETEEEEAHLPSVLAEIHSSRNAFVVFDTEALRNQVVEALSADPLEVKGQTVQLIKLDSEPDTVQWVNFGHSSTGAKIMRLCVGFGCIILACLFWAVVFYAPYAYYVMNFNYENGRQPGPLVGFSFSMIVVIGNAIMYEVCARISDGVGFRFKDDREACYMILYTIACMFNVALDFATTYYTSYLVMTGLGFRTYFGQRLSDIDTFTKQFETYAMQRALAENCKAYAFPSTFLIPFLIEPIVTITLPLAIGRMIVRSHPELQGRAAEEYVASIPLDMGRYADLILNVILGILIFYFPGGYTWVLFFGMAGSHAYIYAFDHWKILRNIPTCVIASMDIDWWAQALLIPCMGLMASCLVFKYNCDPLIKNRLEGNVMLLACCGAFVAHCVVQTLVLVYVVPMCGKSAPEDEEGEEELTFAQLAASKPCSWFTANPVHCLRSKHIYKHSPACQPFHLGKEHHMKVNKAIGCHFQTEKHVEEKA
mmetsp:Transcript_71106/g.186470  ORF Transcript_71106/g.186470 Transcript_71106/m.186470 type:complete len:953 (-) Transcript_71106:195-3053(-)